jgi:hypothetical protein
MSPTKFMKISCCFAKFALRKKKKKKKKLALISLSILEFSQKCATLSFLLRWQNANFSKAKNKSLVWFSSLVPGPLQQVYIPGFQLGTRPAGTGTHDLQTLNPKP